MKTVPATALKAVRVGFWLALLQPLITEAAFDPNDDIFPPAPAAAGAIQFDGHGFIIKGRRTFITSGSVHYPRVPRENWRDVLLKLKRCGFNTVETYVFWNYHEAREGQFDFTTDSRDLGAFLDTAKEVGLYAIVRVGPYSCAEWENGGFPDWLLSKPGLELRKDNGPYLKAVDAWFDRMLPIISARQIHKGGNVILVQLENEQPTDGWRHWGTDMDGEYFRHLLDLAHSNGLEVPMFFSGLHHAHEPAPDTPVDSTKRHSPWMSTELWTIWFDRYGNSLDDLMKGERSTWRVLSRGGNGLNLYMFYGGTTFGYFNFNDDLQFGDKREKGAATYDYGAPIGQAGETRTLYLRLKRLACFAETFSPILADSTNSTEQFQGFARGAMITARTAPSGTIVFLENTGRNAANVLLRNNASVTLAPGEIIGLPLDIPIAPGVTMAEADTRILGIVPREDLTTMICYGEANGTGQIVFSSHDAASMHTVNDAGFTFDSQPLPTLKFTFPAAGFGEDILNFGNTRIRVLAMSKEVADQTWLEDSGAGKQIVVGAPYLGRFTQDASGVISATVEYPWNEPAPQELTVYDGGGYCKLQRESNAGPSSPGSLTLARWTMCLDDAALARRFDDNDWFALADGEPPAMNDDGNGSPFAWYRARLVNSAPIHSLAFRRIGDRATFFVDGKREAAFDLMKDRRPEVQINIPEGDHELGVFVAHSGRTKFAGYAGPVDRLEWQKGLRGPVIANGTNRLILNWKMRGGGRLDGVESAGSTAAENAGGPAFFRSRFILRNELDPGVAYRFRPDGLSFGCVWLNGHNLGRYPEIVKDCPGLWLPTCWMREGTNTLIVFDEQGKSPQNTSVQLETAASRHWAQFKQ